jgi:4-carboxymuconolactone decarboxylase
LEKNRFELGIETLEKMFPAESLEGMKKMKEVSPDFWEMIVGFGYGELYPREGLNLAERELVTLSSLITQGAFEQLDVHIRASLRVGLTEHQIKEVIIQCSGYAGFPKAVQAMKMASVIFADEAEKAKK